MEKYNVREFLNSSYCSTLFDELRHAERKINHALDNYSVNMMDSLETALREAQKSLKIAERELLTEVKDR